MCIERLPTSLENLKEAHRRVADVLNVMSMAWLLNCRVDCKALYRKTALSAYRHISNISREIIKSPGVTAGREDRHSCLTRATCVGWSIRQISHEGSANMKYDHSASGMH